MKAIRKELNRDRGIEKSELIKTSFGMFKSDRSASNLLKSKAISALFRTAIFYEFIDSVYRKNLTV